jgi:hypothetical protein
VAEAHERLAALSRLHAARVGLEQAEQRLAGAVDDAHDAGASWADIAAELRVSRQAARQAFHRRHGKTPRGPK